MIYAYKVSPAVETAVQSNTCQYIRTEIKATFLFFAIYRVAVISIRLFSAGRRAFYCKTYHGHLLLYTHALVIGMNVMVIVGF